MTKTHKTEDQIRDLNDLYIYIYMIKAKLKSASPPCRSSRDSNGHVSFHPLTSS